MSGISGFFYKISKLGQDKKLLVTGRGRDVLKRKNLMNFQIHINAAPVAILSGQLPQN
jgi:hypothetical protein